MQQKLLFMMFLRNGISYGFLTQFTLEVWDYTQGKGYLRRHLDDPIVTANVCKSEIFQNGRVEN